MKNRAGFTLVELVVVILILGILAGVAAPKMFKTSAKATDNALKQTLSVVRDAIELYSAENGGSYPSIASSNAFQALLSPYIRGDFPNCPVGAVGLKGTNTVLASSTTTAATGPWRYDATTGHFAVNLGTATATDALVNYDAL